MNIISTISKALLASTFVFSMQSCDTQGSAVATNTGINTVKNIMNSSTNHGFSVLGNSNDFLTNALINAVIPQELTKINTKLQNLGFGNLVEKEKEYISKAAIASVNVAKPIISSAIQEMTVADAVNILASGKGAATQYLKDKTKSKLIAAIQPQVENQLEINGLNPLLEKANKGKQVADLIGGLLGKKQSSQTDLSQSISKYASEQIVDGLFEVAKDYETKNSSVGGILNSVLGGNK